MYTCLISFLKIAKLIDFDLLFLVEYFISYGLGLLLLVIINLNCLLKFQFDIYDKILLPDIPHIQLHNFMKNIAHAVGNELLKSVIIHSEKFKLVGEVAQFFFFQVG